MTAQILHGGPIAQQLRNDIALQIQQRTAKGLRTPKLAVILVGDNRASQTYVKNKKLACAAVGIDTENYDLAANTSQQDLLEIISRLNTDLTIDGILVQLPLPLQISSAAIIDSINPLKDVDGFNPYNVGMLVQGRAVLRPCTPAGIMLLLQATGVTLAGKHAVVIGRSNIVGLPMLLELIKVKATVTSCGTQTVNLEEEVKRADIVIVATGNPNLIKGSWIKPGSIIIDVGMNHDKDGKLIGDVEFEAAKEHAAWITPVPGGVGPMTIAMLLQNTLTANIVTTTASIIEKRINK